MSEQYTKRKLGDLCEVTKTVNPKSIFSREFSYIDISSINSTLRKIIEPKMLSVNEAPSRARQLVKTNDILFSLTRPYLKNIAFVSSEFNDAVASTGFCVIRPNAKLINPDYLFLIVNSDEFIDQVVAKQKGATYPAVKDSDIFEIEIPLPPLDEQKKIVKMLDEKMGKIAEAKRLRAEALADTEKILSATLHEIFEEGKKNGWEKKTVGDTCSLMTGATPSTSKREYYGGDIKWLVSGDIHNKEIFDCEGRINNLGVKNSNAKLLPKNSLLIALNGQGKTKGTVSTLRVEATCNQSLVAIIPTNKVLVEYLYYCLHSQYKNIRGMAGDDSRKGLNMKIVREINFLMPSILEQQNIVTKLDTLSEKLRTLRDLQIAQLADLKSLERAHLREAFMN